MAVTEHNHPPLSGLDGRRRYVRPPRPIHFPASEEMPETNRHLELRTALYQILKRELAARATIGSDQFVYYDPTNAKKKLAPDAFVKLGVPHATFRVWKTWLRSAPEVGVEVVSDSDEGDEDWEVKLERYRAAGIGEVVRFDPDSAEQPVRVWDHLDGDLVEREKTGDGVFECSCLGLFWVVVPHPLFVRMLRLSRDRAGLDLLPTYEEAERAEARGRAEAEQARDRLTLEVAELRRKLQEHAAKSTPSGKRSRAKRAKPVK
jgi:Uma2 family endonuclease